jgi:hypothetical protein
MRMRSEYYEAHNTTETLDKSMPLRQKANYILHIR